MRKFKKAKYDKSATDKLSNSHGEMHKSKPVHCYKVTAIEDILI